MLISHLYATHNSVLSAYGWLRRPVFYLLINKPSLYSVELAYHYMVAAQIINYSNLFVYKDGGCYDMLISHLYGTHNSVLSAYGWLRRPVFYLLINKPSLYSVELAYHYRRHHEIPRVGVRIAPPPREGFSSLVKREKGWIVSYYHAEIPDTGLL